MKTVDDFIKEIKMEVKSTPPFQYFFYKNDHRGVRLFRVSDRTSNAVQICLNAGEIKKGRGNNIGIYAVDRMTIFGNYGFGNYLKQVDKKTIKNETT